jgi:hypothetical protein
MSETVRETQHEGQEGVGTDSAARILSQGTTQAHIVGPTPGPWSIAGMALIVATEPEFPHRVTVARSNPTGELPPEVEQANARLIAAAPDLLEALRQSEAGLEFALSAGCFCSGDVLGGFICAGHLALRDVRAAIAKAEGR